MVTKKPFGLVWVVFYWIFAGVWCMVLGVAAQAGGGFSAGIRDAMESLRGSTAMATVAELLSLLGFLGFHLGLLMLVTCYGLWTFRKWALSIAKVLAGFFAVGSVIWFIAALVMCAQRLWQASAIQLSPSQSWSIFLAVRNFQTVQALYLATPIARERGLERV